MSQLLMTFKSDFIHCLPLFYSTVFAIKSTGMSCCTFERCLNSGTIQLVSRFCVYPVYRDTWCVLAKDRK